MASALVVGLGVLGGAAVRAEPSTTLRVPGVIVSALASADGRRLLVESREGAQAPCLHVVDASNSGRLRLQGVLQLDGEASMALSPDGQFALVAARTAPFQFGHDESYDLIAVDLAQPDQPVVRWKERVVASHVALSSRATAFAYEHRGNADAPANMETVVVSARDRSRRVVATLRDPSEALALSPGATWLVAADSASLHSWRLDTEPMTTFEQRASPVDRFAPTAFLVVTDQGDVVVSDRRTQRLGVYKPAADLPREASLDGIDDGVSAPLDPNDGEAAPLFLASGEGLVGIDLRQPAAPRVSRMTAPLGSRAVAVSVARRLLFAVDADGGLGATALDGSTDVVGTEADWQRLVKAHAVAMALRTADEDHSLVRDMHAVEALDVAGVRGLLDLPPRGVSAQQAAAVFNDYGFLVAREARPGARVSPLALHALRRAITLDPARRLAYLNLADLLRADAGAADADADRRRQEIVDDYRAYLRLGGKSTPAIAAFVADEPGADLRDPCAAVAAWANAGRLRELTSDSGFGILWRGRRIDLVFMDEGSSRSSVWYGFDAATDEPLADDDQPTFPGADQIFGPDDWASLLTFRSRHYLLHAKDFTHPIDAFSLEDEGRACHFEVATTETVAPASIDRPLCDDVEAGRIEPVTVSEDAPKVDGAAVEQRWSETTATGTTRVDFANDGQERDVARLELASGVASGCGGVFFDLLAPDGSQLAEGPVRDQLIAVQMLRLGHSLWPIECGRDSRFFRWHGRTYLEARSVSWPPTEQADEYHRVTSLQAGKVRQSCDFRFRSVVTAHAVTVSPQPATP